MPWIARHPHEAGRCAKYTGRTRVSLVQVLLWVISERLAMLWLHVFGWVKAKEVAANFLPDAGLLKHFPGCVCDLFHWAAEPCLHRQNWRDKCLVIHLWPSSSNPPQMTVPGYQHIGSQPFTREGLLARKTFLRPTSNAFISFTCSLVFLKVDICVKKHWTRLYRTDGFIHAVKFILSPQHLQVLFQCCDKSQRP